MSSPVTPGDRLLSETATLAGRVVWAAGASCGVLFDEAINCAMLLRALVADRRSQSYRPARLPLGSRARAFAAHGTATVRITNLWQYGVGIEHERGDAGQDRAPRRRALGRK